MNKLFMSCKIQYLKSPKKYNQNFPSSLILQFKGGKKQKSFPRSIIRIYSIARTDLDLDCAQNVTCLAKRVQFCHTMQICAFEAFI